MKLKMSILSPVHISTGNMIPCYVYHYDQGFMDCYDIEKLFQQIPLDELMNLRFEKNSNDVRSKKYISNFFKRKVDYKSSKLQPKYYLESMITDFTCDVKEQAKSLNKPYIPGSTLKGAFMNIIMDHLLNKYKNDVARFIEFYSSAIKKGEFERRLMQFIFDNNFEAIFKQFSSCFIFRDVYFERMILCETNRVNMKKETPFYNLECIDFEQNVTDEFIIIDSKKKELFKDMIKDISDINIRKKYNELILCLNIPNLFIAARKYQRCVIQKDQHYFAALEEECSPDIMKQLNQIDLNNKKSCILRIGNSTNYFYKTVSLFIKRNFDSFYEENFKLFSPVKLNGQKNNPLPENMPRTGNVLLFDKYYLAGMIKIEQCQ